jgi:hypothetical protein
MNQDGISNMINQLDDATKHFLTTAAAVIGVAVIAGNVAYDNLSPDQKEKIVRCLRSVKDCVSHVLNQIGESAAMAIEAGGNIPNHNDIYNNQYLNRDIALQLGLEYLRQTSSPRLQNALGNNSNTNQRGYQR